MRPVGDVVIERAGLVGGSAVVAAGLVAVALGLAEVVAVGATAIGVAFVVLLLFRRAPIVTTVLVWFTSIVEVAASAYVPDPLAAQVQSADEPLVLLLLVASLMFGREQGAAPLPRVVWVPSLVVLFTGWVSGFLNNVPMAVTVAGTWQMMKPWTLLVVVARLPWTTEKFERTVSAMSMVALGVILLSVVEFAMPGAFYSVFPVLREGSEVRGGRTGLQSIFTHPGQFGSMATMFGAIFLARFVATGVTRHLAGAVTAVGLGLLSLRFKVIIGVIGAIAMLFVSSPTRFARRAGVIIVGMVLVFTVGGGVMTDLAAEQLDRYLLSDDSSIREKLYGTSVDIAVDEAPFGAGFGRFGSGASTQFNSPVYEQYGLTQPGLSQDAPSARHDAMWATVLGELGAIGFAFFLGGLLAIGVQLLVLARSARREDVRWMAVVGLAVLSAGMFESLGRPSFFSAVTVLTIALLTGGAHTVARNAPSYSSASIAPPWPGIRATITSVVDLAHFRDIVHRRRAFILLTPLLCGLLALVLATVESDRYRATALILLRDEGLEEEEIETEVELLKTNRLRGRALSALGVGEGAISSVKVKHVRDTRLIRVSVVSSSADVAAGVANALAETYRDTRNETATSDLADERDVLLAQAAALSPRIVDARAAVADLDALVRAGGLDEPELTRARLAQLRRDLTQLESLQLEYNDRALVLETEMFTAGRNVQVTDVASAPRVPFSPTPVPSAVVGIFAGFLLGALAAAVAELVDDPIWDVADAERWSGVPVIASIPHDPDPGAARPIALRDPGHHVSEAFRVMRTTLQYLASGGRTRIMITSADQGDGKTTTSLNLAITMALADGNVALVDADLRLGTVATRAGLEQSEGLSGVLSGSTSLRRELRAVRGCEPGSLDVLPCGPAPANPSELIGSQRMRDVLDVLGSDHESVLIDTPPMLAVSDSLVAARYADGVLLVVRSRTSRGRMVREAVERVQHSGVPVLGVVLNDDHRSIVDSKYAYSADRRVSA